MERRTIDAGGVNLVFAQHCCTAIPTGSPPGFALTKRPAQTSVQNVLSHPVAQLLYALDAPPALVYTPQWHFDAYQRHRSRADPRRGVSVRTAMMQEFRMSRPRVQHVSIPRPPGSADEARRFYSALLGLDEVPPPQSIRHLDLVWYRLGNTELHLFAEEPRADTSGRHFCMEIDDLEALRARLVAGGYTPEETTPIPGRPRFFCRDPFGNSIEFTTILSDYLASVEAPVS